ncbi:MAG: PDZ domain-containing protein [Erysipelotrichaceae bacterium]|nr:PDZ domain-containing protein [Erysipelotrichaceae bacterium]
MNDRQTAFRYGVNEYGLYIYATEEDSPASKAGLKSGDRIISVEDEKIETAEQLKNKIQEYEVGDVITFKIERNGKEHKIDVTLDEQKS